LKIALDPYMFRCVPLTDLPGIVADLDYSCIELSPRADAAVTVMLDPQRTGAGVVYQVKEGR
jgi:hypothetical protein